MQYCSRGDLCGNSLAMVSSAELPHSKRLLVQTIYNSFGVGCLIPWLLVHAPSAVHEISSLSAVAYQRGYFMCIDRQDTQNESSSQEANNAGNKLR